MQACNRFASSISVESPLQVRVRHVGAIDHSTNAAQPRNASQHQTSTHNPDDKFYDDITDSDNYLRVLDVLVFASVLLI